MIEVSICPQSLIPFVPQGKRITLSDLLQIKKGVKIKVPKGSIPKPISEIEKQSRKEYDRQRYLLNREAILKARAEWWIANKERLKAYHRRHYREKKAASRCRERE